MAREDERPVQQSVLDRLMDSDPRSVHEYPLTRMQSVRALRIAVRRDLEWLLNTRSNPEVPPETFQNVRNSVYTFGLPDASSLSSDSLEDRRTLLRSMERSIANFEPRLSGVRVSEVPMQPDGPRQIRFIIHASLRMDPNPEKVVFDTVLDLATGQYAVKGDASA